jgi:hypothetical protein
MNFWKALRLASVIVFVVLVLTALLFAGHESHTSDADIQAAPTVIR